MILPPRERQRPVLFFANGIGDTILALPAVRALASILDPRLALVCDQDIYPSLLNELEFGQVVETAMTRNVPDWTREFAVGDVAASLGECDLFISLVPWYSQSLDQLLRALKPECSVGFFAAFDYLVPLNFHQHAADLAFDIPTALDPSLRIDAFAAPLRPGVRAVRTAESIRRTIPYGHRVLAVHADTGPLKMWPAERFIEVLDSFLDRHAEFVVLLLGGSQLALDSGRRSDRVVPCYGLSLEGSMSLVGLADMFLGVDSCLLHAADLYRVPGVGLFGDSSPLEFGFRFSEVSIVCAASSMREITVASVLDALERVADGLGTLA